MPECKSRDSPRGVSVAPPKLGKKKLPEIEYENVTEITDKLAPSEQSHCLAVARTFLRWCVKPPRRYIPHSPLEGVLIVPAKARKRILKPNELKELWDAATVEGYQSTRLS